MKLTDKSFWSGEKTECLHNLFDDFTLLSYQKLNL
jgi:hypothetical protein